MEDSDEERTFGRGEWILKEKGSVVIIGKDLYNGEGGKNCAFPLNFIVYKLEGESSKTRTFRLGLQFLFLFDAVVVVPNVTRFC